MNSYRVGSDQPAGLVIGISGEPLLREKTTARYLQSWGERARAVAALWLHD